MYEIFEKLLKERGISTYQVSKATGISTASFTGWKQGKWNFKIDKLQKIADYFGVSLEYLMGYEKTVVPIEQTGGLSPEYINVAVEARNKGYTPEDIKLALNMLDMARGKKIDAQGIANNGKKLRSKG